MLDPRDARMLATHLSSPEVTATTAGSAVVVALVEIDNWQLNEQQLGACWGVVAVDRVSRALWSAAGPDSPVACHQMKNGSWMLVEWITADFEKEPRISDVVRTIVRDCRRSSSVRLSAAVSEEISGPQALTRACDDALIMLSEKLVLGGDRVWLSPERQACGLRKRARVRRIEHDLVAHMRAHEPLRAVAVIDRWVDDLCLDPTVQPQQVTDWLTGLVLHVMDVTGNVKLPDGSTDWAEVLDRFPIDRLRELSGIHERSALSLALMEIFWRMDPDVEDVATATTGELLMQQIEAYIRSNYSASLTLASVADALYVSPFYVSKLFQRQRQTTFLRFLTGVRMAHARRLLVDSQLQVDAVAHAVGFQSSRHFRTRFKQLFHTTPKEYRHQSVTARSASEVA